MLDAKADDDAAIVAKYHATTQFKRALQLINPSREQRSECEYWIVFAIRLVPECKKDDSAPPAETKKELKKGIKKLRAAIPFVLELPLRWALEEYVEMLENRAGGIVVEKGKPRRSNAKRAAVHYAHELLTMFGKPRTYHRKGVWHELAKVLCPGAKDLFDYIEEYRSRAAFREPFPPKKFALRLADIGRW
jgi:hypothetical protein